MKGKESNKYDLCKVLQIRENYFTSEADLPVQDLDHIQHTCEAQSETHTIWKELTEEFEEELQWLNITADSIWNTVREHETKSPFTQPELKIITTGQSRESVSQKRFWRLRPDDLAFRLPTKTSTGTLYILEFNRMRKNKNMAPGRI